MSELKQLRYEHNKATAKALKTIGIHIDYDELEEKSKNQMITRLNFAKSLIQFGYASNVEDALSKYLHKGGSAYVEYETKPFDMVAKRIHDAGGIVCLAHPAEYGLNDIQTERLIESLRSYGLDGIECIHPSIDRSYSVKLTQIAMKNHMIITGGSDFHARLEENIELGVGGDGMLIPANLLHNFNFSRERY